MELNFQHRLAAVEDLARSDQRRIEKLDCKVTSLASKPNWSFKLA